MEAQKGIRTMIFKRLILGATLAAAAAGIAPSAAQASSHREAPLITEDPTVDATDLYAFRNGDNVVFVANYIPFELPSGGPNFHRFSDNAVYRINIDNNAATASADVVFEFRFRTVIGNTGTFLYNTGPIDATNRANVRQLMTVTRISGTTSTVLAMDVEVAPAYVGRHSFTTPLGLAPIADPTAANATYDAYVQANNVHMLTGVTGGRVFAGPRDDPFYADLGSVFDLLRVRPLNPGAGSVGNVGGGVDHLAGFNTHSIVLEVPITSIMPSGAIPTDPSAAASIIGVWTTAHRPRVRVRRGPLEEHHGQLVQVSRLGNPLINEVLIPLSRKDFFNGSSPADDIANYGDLIVANEVTTLLNALYYTGLGTPASQTVVGGALQAILAGFNTGVTPSDVLHLNLAVPGNAFPTAGSSATLGALRADNAGYPNGRRLADDVVDIDLQVLSGILAIPPMTGVTCPGAVNCGVGDGVNNNDVAFSTTFPYLARPHEGYAQGSGRLEGTQPQR